MLSRDRDRLDGGEASCASTNFSRAVYLCGTGALKPLDSPDKLRLKRLTLARLPGTAADLRNPGRLARAYQSLNPGTFVILVL